MTVLCAENFRCKNCEDKDTWVCEGDLGHKGEHFVWVKHEGKAA